MQYYMRAAKLAYNADNLSRKFSRAVTPANTAALRAIAQEFEQFQRDLAADAGIRRTKSNYDDPEGYIPNLILHHVERLHKAVHDAEIPGMDPKNYRRVNAIRLVLVSAFVDTLDTAPRLRFYGTD